MITGTLKASPELKLRKKGGKLRKIYEFDGK